MGDTEGKQPGESKRRTGYLEPYSVYAARYGGSERTVKRWVATGTEGGDSCPLDDPEQMRLWWVRNSTQRVPAKLLAAAVEFRRNNPSTPQPAVPVGSAEKFENPSPEKSEGKATRAPDLRPVDDGEVGVEATLRRLQQAEVREHRKYEIAREEGSNSEADIARKNFSDLAIQVARVEKAVIEHRLATGDLIPRLVGENSLLAIHSDFHGHLRSMSDRIFRVFGVPITPENDAKWQELVDNLCEVFQTEVFRKGGDQ